MKASAASISRTMENSLIQFIQRLAINCRIAFGKNIGAVFAYPKTKRHTDRKNGYRHPNSQLLRYAHMLKIAGVARHSTSNNTSEMQRNTCINRQKPQQMAV